MIQNGATVVALISLSTTALANGWTGFQGPVPQGANLEAAPLTWSPSEGLLWKAEIPGYGQSSPVTWGGRVFVTSVSGPQKEHCHVTAFDLETGKIVWKHELEAATRTESNNYVSKAAPTPVVDAEGVICFFEGGNLIALNHEGQVRWQRNLVQEFGPIESRHGLAASLEQSDNHVFVWVERQADPYVLSVNKASGRDDWKVPGLGVTSWASPRLVPVKESQHLVLSGIGRITGLDPATGKVLWNFTEIKRTRRPLPFRQETVDS